MICPVINIAFHCDNIIHNYHYYTVTHKQLFSYRNFSQDRHIENNRRKDDY